MAGFSDYQKEIINAYQTLKKNGRLASELEDPSPAQLRNYCLEIWARRLEKADAPVIKSFFDPGNRYDDLEAAIDNCDIDRLRPLINFINGEVRNTDAKNIKLLAWLIDFSPRPYELWKETKRTPKPLGLDKIRKSIQGAVMLSFIVFASMVGVYWFGNQDEHQCMHWADDHYKAVGCMDETIQAGIAKIALDNHRLNTFRRVTQPDTLTYDDVGKVWYTKITNDSLDFFTGPGKHPVHTQKYLKPATKYILGKYVYARKARP